jgi:class 3 adenylate cyclase
VTRSKEETVRTDPVPRGELAADLAPRNEEAREERLVLAVTSVNGATAACATHGDRATLGVVRAAHAAMAASCAAAGGEVVKALGDGLLVAFPAARAREAVEALRAGRERADALWRALDARCAVQVRATAGTVLRGPLAPGDARPDVYGDALNRLFKLPPAPLLLTPELEALL